MMQILQCGVAFLATMCFAVLFHAPRKQLVFCGFTGMVGWATYLLCLPFGLEPASFLATVALTCMARLLAVKRACPVTVFLMSGVFALVPGLGIYRTTYHFIQGDTALSAFEGAQTIKIAVCIALGIVAVSTLPGRLFGNGRAGEA